MAPGNGSATASRRDRMELESVQAEIQPLNRASINLEVIGKTPLICHAWSVKAKRQMLETQMADPKTKTKKKARDPKNPFEDFVGSLHILPGATLPAKKLRAWDAWPYRANTFAAPTATFAHGARLVMNDLGMDKANRRSIFVIGEWAVLKYKQLVMREDMVRLDCWPPKPDIRYRGMFEEWSTEITVEYDADLSSPVQIVNLFNRAGTYSGALEWRPSSPKKPGTFGMYFVKGEKA